MIIYYSYTLFWTEAAVQDVIAQLPPLRRKKAERYRQFSGQRESAAATLLAVRALWEDGVTVPSPRWRECPAAALIQPGDWPRRAAALDWTPAPDGKPFANGILCPEANVKNRRYLSLSHTEGAVAAAVAGRPLGVDIQAEQPLRPGFFEGILRRFSSPEQERLSALPPEKRTPAFYAHWAMKESVMKLCGQGLRLPMDSFCLYPEGEGRYRSSLEGRPLRLFTRRLPGTLAAPDGYTLAAAEYAEDLS